MEEVVKEGEELTCRVCNKTFVEIREAAESEPDGFRMGVEDGQGQEASYRSAVPTTVEGMEGGRDRTEPGMRGAASVTVHVSNGGPLFPTMLPLFGRQNMAAGVRDNTGGPGIAIPFFPMLQVSNSVVAEGGNMNTMDILRQIHQMLGMQNPGDYVFGDEMYNTILAQSMNVETQSHAAAPDAVAALPKFELPACLAKGECPVCREELSPGKEVMQMPCSHLFCTSCLEPWLRVNNTCPTCRFELRTNDPEYEQQRAVQEAMRSSAQRSGRQGTAMRNVSNTPPDRPPNLD
eukprot:CAMPEP_0184683600 /NCGR_PEP_ID=MMETSP0312-20130426/11973_1 /TAXON_ID=31354 /ORGANISM="Compsopogon coeruleus, Strain SAG 36.94" /LENGTH=290 /DNA_ID=CAMNT_0027136065 /DNA_START=245 /DNA_END=1117 /DNA_ORIENTATION=-